MSLPDLPSALARALDARGYNELTPVQTSVIQPEAEGRDLLVSAQTGSGKTVAYGLALAGDLLNDAGAMPPPGKPLALVIAPTRELALQVQRELEWLYAAAGARVASCVGGMDPRREQRALAAGVHIVVGTPGRLRDHLERGNLQTSNLKAVVLDEADEMLDLGFREELEALLDAAPAERRTLLFSATLPRPIVTMAAQYQRDALRITTVTQTKGHGDIDYRAVRIAPSDAEHAVVNLLRYFDPGAAIVFCSTRESVRRLHANLVERGFSVVALSGELTQNERTHALQALRDRRARVCVATDVAARGIDIPDLELVIHAELPTGAESLQHRSGRTGRAGKKGISAILVTHPRRRRAEALMRTANINATWMAPPSADDIRARDQERLIEQLRPTEEAAEEDLVIARALLESAEAEQVIAALVRGRRAAMPAPEDLVDNEPEPQAGFNARPAARAGFENTAWFKIDIGRNKNAEARWLLPMICRRGHLTKSDIGAIRVFDRETRFEIVREAVDRFTAAIAKVEDDEVHIEPLNEPDLPPARDRGPRKPAGPRKANFSAPREEAAGESAELPRRPAFRPRTDRQPEQARPAPAFKPRADRAPREDRAPRDDRPRDDRPRDDRPRTAPSGPKPVTSKKQTGKFGGPKPSGKPGFGKPGPKGGKKSNGKSRWED